MGIKSGSGTSLHGENHNCITVALGTGNRPTGHSKGVSLKLPAKIKHPSCIVFLRN